MAFPHDEDHNISFTAGAALTRKYRESIKPGQIKGGYFSKASILALLEQPNCAGIRIYFGLNDEGEQELVLVGTEDNGNDQIGSGYQCMDTFVKCPDKCGDNNILNS